MDNIKLVGNKNGQAVTDSLIVAEQFGKSHQHVMEAIRKLTVENSTVKSMFVKGLYTNSRNQEFPKYYMNRDGFTLLVVGFTGKKALKFKLAFINQFNAMEIELKHNNENALDKLITVSTNIVKSTKNNSIQLKEQDNRISNLEENMTMNRVQKSKLHRFGKERALQLMDGKNSPAYKKYGRKVFSNLWNRFNYKFELASYEELPKVKYQEAMNYLTTTDILSHEIKFDIDDANGYHKF